MLVPGLQLIPAIMEPVIVELQEALAVEKLLFAKADPAVSISYTSDI